jgi:hypothetical protein
VKSTANVAANLLYPTEFSSRAFTESKSAATLDFSSKTADEFASGLTPTYGHLSVQDMEALRAMTIYSQSWDSGPYTNLDSTWQTPTPVRPLTITKSPTQNFTYETASGLIVETGHYEFPVFDPQQNGLIWYDPQQLTVPVYYDGAWQSSDERMEIGLTTAADAFVQSTFASSLDLISSNAIQTIADASLPDTQAYLPDSWITRQANSLTQFLSASRPRIVGQVQANAKQRLLGTSEQVCMETKASDHAIHFEDVNRSQEHSVSNDRSSVFRSLYRSGIAWLRTRFNNWLMASFMRLSRTSWWCAFALLGGAGRDPI